ncbi:MAG: hypothetical protein LBJ74_02950 [Heliobacteriaceae bacterium]|jgi:hypothetical protein|nr:hypothetical protein [Heliobacteriaceae bacterium]
MSDKDYASLIEWLLEDASNMLPEEINDSQRKRILIAMKHYTTIMAEYLEEKELFNDFKIVKIIAEWTYCIALRLADSKIPYHLWDEVIPRPNFAALSIYEEAIVQNINWDETLSLIERHVDKAFAEAIQLLYDNKLINQKKYDAAVSEPLCAFENLKKKVKIVSLNKFYMLIILFALGISLLSCYFKDFKFAGVCTFFIIGIILGYEFRRAGEKRANVQ